MVKKLLVCGLGIALGGCFQPMKPSDGHLKDQPSPPAASIPPAVQAVPSPPKPKPTVRPETYSVVVNQVSARELLFALARDAKMNVDIHPGITGSVTLNAIDQTLPQLLNRISKQVDMRYEIDGPNLVVMPDAPYLRIYKIDYVNMQRSTSGQVTVAGNIAGGASAGGGAGGGANAGGGGGGGSNTSTVSVRNESSNDFWKTLVKNVEEILRETDKVLPGGPSAAPTAPPPPPPPAGAAPGAAAAPPAAGPNITFREAASVIANPEAGILTLRATSRQHEKIQEFLDYVLLNARRQVLIEATVVEVQLNNNYQQGINWEIFNRPGTAPGITGGMFPTPASLAGTPTGSILTLRYNSTTFALTVRLLEQFGAVRVVSSPRVSVVNNQTAILKVVDNLVYFTISAQQSQGVQGSTLATFTTTPNSVAVGFVMNVTPQISGNDVILLNVKPTISKVLSFVNDPNPALANPCGAATSVAGTCGIPPIVSQIPQIQTRELESVIKVANGDVAVMGGLIQDSVNTAEDTIPGVNRVPILGDVFSNKNMQNSKTELVVFLRPVVIRDASLDGDYRGYRVFVPGDDFLSQPHPARKLCDFRIDPGCPR
jgi:general secretion pathway protein D